MQNIPGEKKLNIVDMKEQALTTAPARNVSVGLTTIAGFELAQRAAKLLSTSTLVPERYRGNLPDCVVALNMAQRMGSDPLMTMQNLYVVHGTPAWSAQMLISVWNQCGRYTSIRYVFEGKKGSDEWGCRAVSMERETKEKIEGALVSIATAKAEGWYNRKGSKWQTMPEQMLRYRAAAWLVRANAPELAMGFQTVDEVKDVYEAERDTDGTFSVAEARGEEEPAPPAESDDFEIIAEIVENINTPAECVVAKEMIEKFDGSEEMAMELSNNLDVRRKQLEADEQ